MGKRSNIKSIIESSRLQLFVNDKLDYSAEEYDKFHSLCASELIESFKKLECNYGIENSLTYGRAAKIIAIYLKTCVVFCKNSKCNKSNVIHPPIDGTLLLNLSKIESLKCLKSKTWTTLNEDMYWKIISQIRQHFNKSDWTIEEYWTPEGRLTEIS